MRALLLLALPLLAEPRLVLKKEFPQSTPAYAEIRLSRDGKLECLDSPADESPVRYRLSEADTETVFELAAKLDKFSRALESPLKVAFMGKKTFRWEDGDTVSEVSFNYSEDADARTLLDWYERMVESALYKIDLEKCVRYDRLGVNQSVLRLEAAWDRKRLLAVEQYLPLLDRIAKNDVYLNMARDRAERLAAVFRESLPKKVE